MVSMADFNRCLDACGLLELHSKGRKFSWSNGQEGHAISCARLDTAAINAHFFKGFSIGVLGIFISEVFGS